MSNYTYNVDTYPVLWIDDTFLSRLNKKLGVSKQSRPDFIREVVWDFLESGEFDHDEFKRLDCGRPYHSKKLGNKTVIQCVKEREYVVKIFQKRAKELGISKTELFRYILKRELF